MSHGLPDPPREPVVNVSLDGLAPKFRAALEAMMATFSQGPHESIIVETLRTPERQAWLYGFGREYDDGRGVVTQASTNTTTWHGYGLAVDIVSKRDGWDAPAEYWNALGVAAQAHGLAWGGSWPRFQDRPHVQWGPPMRQAPSQHAAELLTSGQLQQIWQEVEAT